MPLPEPDKTSLLGTLAKAIESVEDPGLKQALKDVVIQDQTDLRSREGLLVRLRVLNDYVIVSNWTSVLDGVRMDPRWGVEHVPACIELIKEVEADRRLHERR